MPLTKRKWSKVAAFACFALLIFGLYSTGRSEARLNPPTVVQKPARIQLSINTWEAASKAQQLQKWYEVATNNAIAEYQAAVADSQRKQEEFAAASARFNLAAQAAKSSAKPKPAPAPTSRPGTPTRRSGTSTAGSGACGGDLPSCATMNCESGGSLTAHNSSGADGKWQIMPGTWNNYMGYPTPSSAPESIQDARAREILASDRASGRDSWTC